MDELHEARCRRCGSCCRESGIIDSGERIILDIYCPALDPETRLCMIYEHRHTKSAWHLRGDRPCLAVWIGMKLGTYPGDCVYAEEGYQGAVYDPSRLSMAPKRLYEEMKASKAILRQRIREVVREWKSGKTFEEACRSVMDAGDEGE